jgi:hypothetical protein
MVTNYNGVRNTHFILGFSGPLDWNISRRAQAFSFACHYHCEHFVNFAKLATLADPWPMHCMLFVASSKSTNSNLQPKKPKKA